MAKNEELRKKLLIEKKNGGRILPDEEIQNAQDFSKGYKKFLNEGKTEREAAYYAIRCAKEKGFKEFDKNKKSWSVFQIRIFWFYIYQNLKLMLPYGRQFSDKCTE